MIRSFYLLSSRVAADVPIVDDIIDFQMDLEHELMHNDWTLDQVQSDGRKEFLPYSIFHLPNRIKSGTTFRHTVDKKQSLCYIEIRTPNQNKKEITKMFPFSFLITPLSILLSLTTASGVFIHDMRIDKVAVAAVAAPVLAAGSVHVINFSSDLHTHAERGSLQQVGESSQNPLIQPRTNNRRYLSQKNLGFGHEPFDSYRLPLA